VNGSDLRCTYAGLGLRENSWGLHDQTACEHRDRKRNLIDHHSKTASGCILSFQLLHSGIDGVHIGWIIQPDQQLCRMLPQYFGQLLRNNLVLAGLQHERIHRQARAPFASANHNRRLSPA
jgi:hypothetical protein